MDTENDRACIERCNSKDVANYGLTTAGIYYVLPDFVKEYSKISPLHVDRPDLPQLYLWQEYDTWPQFPELRKFLKFWRTKIEGPLHSVTVAHARLIAPKELRADGNRLIALN